MLMISIHADSSIFDVEYEKLSYTYDAELHDFSSVLSDICIIFDNLNCFQLKVGYASTNIVVDIRTDLAVLLEQLPELLDFLDSEDETNDNPEFCLDFYEQGVEMSVQFLKTGDKLDVSILDNKVPIGAEHKILARFYQDVRTLDHTLTVVLLRFTSYASLLCPELIKNEAFRPWLNLKSVQSRLLS